MRIVSLNFDEAGDPESATFHMSVREMAYLTKLLGAQTGIKADATMPGGSRIDCYSPLARVFNHWDDGVDDYLRGATT